MLNLRIEVCSCSPHEFLSILEIYEEELSREGQGKVQDCTLLVSFQDMANVIGIDLRGSKRGG